MYSVAWRQVLFDNIRLYDMTDARPFPPEQRPVCGSDYCIAQELTHMAREWLEHSPLHMAAWQGSVLSAFDLLSGRSGGSINANHHIADVNLLDAHGRSPLHLACYHGSVKLAKYDRERGELFEVADSVVRTITKIKITLAPISARCWHAR